ncbi:probable G-protein coupled receptor Mth-like 1 [Diorhabda carinulata]|uniref:probable G-protein coupled receptor Mth-like 1 n=1 Tax=Diorhabda carinulata TaxID=1163345 RepID=UPI0025A05B2A|nr:probable G-protein coupled receptor Mth-like 1 [Diorhabda carinulata]
MPLLTKLYSVVLLSVTVLSIKLPKTVNINKCCKFNELLTIQNQTCAQNSSSSWNLEIYNARKGKFELFTELPVNWKVKEDNFLNCSKPQQLKFQQKNNFPFLNGSVFSLEFNRLFHPNEFCLDYQSALVCLNEPENLIVIKKCCGDNAIFSQTKSTCITIKDVGYKIDVGQNRTLGAGFPPCADNNMHVVGELRKSTIMNNGSLLVDNKLHLGAGNFCLEHVLEQTERSASIITCPEYIPQVHKKLIPSQNETDIRFTLYPIGLAISAIFLAATLAAGSLLPASHHVLHWRCQTNHVACLLVGDVLLCITHLSGPIAFVPCFSIAVSMLFLFLSAFFWLNTMCFNIWWTFRDLRPQSTEKSQERLRLRLYEVYAWGIPLLITVIAASLDLSSNQDEVLRPRFAEHNCWFAGDVEKLTYFFGPVGTLLFINLLLFGLTARELTCGLWKRELVKSTTERAALGRVCLKLVVVMGVTWIADLISFAAGGPQEIWYVTDIVNSIHGVFIFIVVGCQPQVLSAVKRFWCMRKHRQNGTAGTTNHHSTSSQGPQSMGDTLTNTNSVLTNGTTKTVPLETSC